MKYIHVVPARRMPVTMQTLTYGVSDETPLQPGQLVEVPLRGTPIIGVVWRCDVSPEHHRIQSVSRIITSFPVLTPWLRLLLEQASESSHSSLSDLVYSTLPKLSATRLQKLLAAVQVKAVIQPEQNISNFRFIDRSEGIRWVTEHIGQQLSVTLAPTLADVHDIVEAFHARGKSVTAVTGDMTPTDQAKLFVELLSGHSLTIVGTQRALFLPFPTTPTILVDQVEHHAHKTQAQHPRLDTRSLLTRCAIKYSTTSAAASIQFALQPVQLPESVAQQRYLASLNREKGFSWLTDEAIEAIESVIAVHGKIVCIVPQTGYASSFTCRQCGYSPTCPNCHHAASLMHGEREELRCRHCSSDVPALASCPNCRGVSWAYHGLGVERFRDYIAQQWPDVTIATTIRRDIPADIAIDTYSSYVELFHITDVELVIIVIGDVMLNAPDFSTNERVWQYLARIQAFAHGRKVLVQTFQPDQVFWQRWLHGDEETWFTDEQTTRTSLRLPPFSVQWVVRFSGERKIFERGIHDVQVRYADKLRCSFLPTDKRRSAHKCLVEFIDPSLTTTEDWATILPTPWQIDTSPQSWLD